MPQPFYFVTHADVVISKHVPGAALAVVGPWPRANAGGAGLAVGGGPAGRLLQHRTKALDSADIFARHLGVPVNERQDLGENDRSATGFLPPDEFESVADQFFAVPGDSARGWERAIDAQQRVVQAVLDIAQAERGGGPVAIVSHGAVGTLLYCHLAGKAISRRWDQPPNGGGNWFGFSVMPPGAHSHWQPVDGAPV